MHACTHTGKLKNTCMGSKAFSHILNPHNALEKNMGMYT